MSIGLTPGDKLASALQLGARCKITFSTGSIEIGDVRYYGDDLWVLSTPSSQHFFGLDEVRDVCPVA